MAAGQEHLLSGREKADGTDAATGNSFQLSELMRNNGTELYGARLIHLPVKDDPVTHVKNVRALKVREDDVYVLAFPKCGTHWIWEVTQMLLNQTVKYETRAKEHVMLELCEMSGIDAEPSPRILNSHLWMVHLPKEIVPKKAKIIHVVRNPKDTIVSFYHHGRQIPENSFTFSELLQVYMANQELSVAHQFEYLRQMSEFEKAHPDHPIKLVYFEEMKKDPVAVTKELAEFLQVPVTDEFCEQIASACSFDKLKAADLDKKTSSEYHAVMKDGPKIQVHYRKGTIGDWKNHFTVAQNEIFDDFIARELANGLDHRFIYE